MRISIVTFALMLSFAANAFAYVGPGMGIGALGVLVGLISTIVMAIIGLVWYPLKRALKSKTNTLEDEPEETDDALTDKQEENAVN